MKAIDHPGIVMNHDLNGNAYCDLTRWMKGSPEVQIFSIYCDGNAKHLFAFANREMDTLDAEVAHNSYKFAKVATIKN